MADFLTCYDWMMDNEDRGRVCAIVQDDPPGAHAISGINSAAYPQQFAQIAALPQSQREPAVQSFYQVHFWNQWYAQLFSNNAAKRIFDEGVNAGPGTTVKVAQIAARCPVDGEWGPNTVAAINADGDGFVYVFQQARLAHYQAIVARNPADAKYLGTAQNPGPWWIRATQ